MDAARETTFQRLQSNLDGLAAIYRQLLDVVYKERELLISADLDQLRQNTESKEAILQKARFADTVRVRIAEEMAAEVGANAQDPRLLEISDKLGGEKGAQLRRQHQILESLIRKVTQANLENEEYTKSALRNLDGAMNNLKESISGKKTYGGKGRYKMGPEVSGNFVSKEA